METIEDMQTNKEPVAQSGTNHLFPVFLKLEELNILLVGAGKSRFGKTECNHYECTIGKY